ncbi:MAG: hypothetical protein IKR09_07410 [Alphaproteobacteria bacterium]|nr:hypothetical protein [Alphaproteobacteria bacterium]
MKKISVIGAGYVGSSIAYSLMLIEAAEEIALIDINDTAVNAEVADIRPGLAEISSAKVFHGSYADTANSDIVIITAGVNRKVGETRMDLIGKNSVIARDIAAKLKENNAHGLVIVVSNPVDVITQIIAEELNETTGRVFGTGCLLDSARFHSVLGDFLGVAEKSIRAFVAGEHGSNQILLWSSVTVENQPLPEWLTAHNRTLTETDKQTIAQRIADMGASIIKGKGHTHYGIAGCVAYIINEIKQGHTICVPLTRPLNGEFGHTDTALSLPCFLNENGIIRSDTSGFYVDESEAIKTTVEKVKIMLGGEI